MMRMHLNVTSDSNVLGTLLLDMSALLLKAGANCNRIKLYVSKVANLYGLLPDVIITPNSITVSLIDTNENTVFDGIQGTSAPGVNFLLISRINGLCSVAVEKNLTISQLQVEFEKVQTPNPYGQIITLSFVSLAGSAFCYTFGGNAIEMLIAFGATFFGLFTKQKLTKHKTNPYVVTFVAATVAAFFTVIFHVTALAPSPVNAFTTCVLFLVPGVLLINGCTDLIDGNIINGVASCISAFMHTLAIALGLATIVIIFNLNG